MVLKCTDFTSNICFSITLNSHCHSEVITISIIAEQGISLLYAVCIRQFETVTTIGPQRTKPHECRIPIYSITPLLSCCFFFTNANIQLNFYDDIMDFFYLFAKLNTLLCNLNNLKSSKMVSSWCHCYIK